MSVQAEGRSRVEASNRVCIIKQERSGSEGGGPSKEDEFELSLASGKAAG